MTLCHPLDMRFDRLASGLVLQATCYLQGCGRMYGRLVPKDTSLTPDVREFYRNRDDWATLLTMRQLIDEMRCTQTTFCEECLRVGAHA